MRAHILATAWMPSQHLTAIADYCPASPQDMHRHHPDQMMPLGTERSHLGHRLDALPAAHLLQLQLLNLVLGALPPLAHRRAKVALHQGGGGAGGGGGGGVGGEREQAGSRWAR